ncbi:MAG: hypothetical protein JSV24_11875 [Bacteroidales bacterium]|nr:MAG: hypothetical protein JSV24_11875 [Bacteroidales bacterium]
MQSNGCKDRSLQKTGTLPSQPVQELSSMCLMIGCTINPVTGAAIHKIVVLSNPAPRVLKMRLIGIL